MDIQVTLDNLVTAIEYIRQHSNGGNVSISYREFNHGVTFEFTDINNKKSIVTVFSGPTTPEVQIIQKIYRNPKL